MRMQLNRVEVIGASAREIQGTYMARGRTSPSLATLTSLGFSLSQHMMVQAAYRRPRSHGAWSIIARKIGVTSPIPSIMSMLERGTIHDFAFQTRSSVVRSALSMSSRTFLTKSSLKMVKILVPETVR